MLQYHSLTHCASAVPGLHSLLPSPCPAHCRIQLPLPWALRVTLGNKFERASNFDAAKYQQNFDNRSDFPDWIPPKEVEKIYLNHPSGNVPNLTSDDQFLMGSTREIEKIRPQSPPPQSKANTAKTRAQGRTRPM